LVLAAFVVPALVVVVGLQFYPLAYSVYMAVEHWSLLESPGPLGWVGLGNFKRVLEDPVFPQAVRNSLVITTASVIIELLVGTALAYLTLGSRWFVRAARTALLLPMVIAPVAAGTIWRMLFNADTGPINAYLAKIGIHGPDWLAHANTAIMGLIVVDVWQWTPFVMLVVAAGAAAIAPDLPEAAAVEGATRWQIFRRIELPLLVPILVLVAMFRVLDSLLSLDTVYSMTYGGPGHGTYTLTYYIYTKGLRGFELGQSAAASWLFMAFAVLIIAFMFRLRRKTMGAGASGW
jgi:ABC-type sugar transport system permease subunit